MSSRLYDASLVAAVVVAGLVAIAVDTGATWEVRSELHGSGLSGLLPGWGRLEAPALRFEPHGRVVHLAEGARIERSDLDLWVGRAQVGLTAQRARLRDIEGRIGTTKVAVTDVRMQEGDLFARDIEVTGSLRARTVDSVRVREVTAAMAGLERWRRRAQDSWMREDTMTAGAVPPVRLRVSTLTERSREVVLRNLEISFAGGARLRARAVTVPKSGSVCLLREVTLEAAGRRLEHDEMSLDLETLELVPRRSLVARTLGQQWGTGLRLDQLEETR